MQQVQRRPQPKSPEDQLPPATQKGKNTFGCLVNGQPWTPQGNNGTPRFDVYYDPGINGGYLNIAAYRAGDKLFQDILMRVTSVQGTGTYSFQRPASTATAFYVDSYSVNGCMKMYTEQDIAYCDGTVELTRFDVPNRVVAGVFTLKLL
jgi:hypothetical protein